MNTEEAWRTWWEAEGKHMERLPHHNAIDHMASVTRIAWLNGAFDAADQIDRLLNERNAFKEKRDELISISNKLKRERDEARRKLCVELLEVEGHPIGWGGLRGAEGIAQRLGWGCFQEDNP